MEQNAIKKAIQVAKQWNIFRPMIEAGVSSAEIKQVIIEVLDPHFANKDILHELAIELLASEAYRVLKIKQDSLTETAFHHTLGLYKAAATSNAPACFSTCAESEEDELRAIAEHWSLLYLELDKTQLPLEEFRHEVFRNIGALVEGFLQAYLRDLLVQVRISRGKTASYTQASTLKLGNIVNELYVTLGMPEIVAPPPWGIRLNQWRNMAQHLRSRVHNGRIHAYYGEPPNEQEIILTRDELGSVLERIYSICMAVSTARTIFFIDNVREIRQYLPPGLELRGDAQVLLLATALSTQGFEVSGIHLTENEIEVVVRDLSDNPANERMIHASQFVYPVWKHFPRATVRVKYLDKKGVLRLTTTATDDDCKAIADGTIPFADLASRVRFEVTPTEDISIIE